MAKRVEGWSCETCGGSYGDEPQALACEAKHVTPEITGFKWDSSKQLPIAIIVSYSINGTKHTREYEY